jgi:hypothetical protein
MIIKKYKVKFEDKKKLVKLNSESEFNQLKKEYNEYEFIKIEQMSKYIARKIKSSPDTQPTLKDILKAIEGINLRLDRHEEILTRNSQDIVEIKGVLEKHSDILARNSLDIVEIKGVLEKHSDILARNNLN